MARRPSRGECRRQRSGRGNPVPLYTLTADDLLETGVVAGLDEDKIALRLPIRRSPNVRLFPTAECAGETRIGGEMSDDDPGTSAGGRLWGLDRPPQARNEAIPECPHLSANSL